MGLFAACGDSGVSAPAACDDGIWNGDETDLDCGGECMPCEAGGGCASEADCLSGICTEEAMRATKALADRGVSLRHLHVSTLKPFADCSSDSCQIQFFRLEIPSTPMSPLVEAHDHHQFFSINT